MAHSDRDAMEFGGVPTLDDYLSDVRTPHEENAHQSALGKGILGAGPEVQIARAREAFARMGHSASLPLRYLGRLGVRGREVAWVNPKEERRRREEAAGQAFRQRHAPQA